MNGTPFFTGIIGKQRVFCVNWYGHLLGCVVFSGFGEMLTGYKISWMVFVRVSGFNIE